jgi:hypothetical protein
MCLEDYVPKSGVEREVYKKLINGDKISKGEAGLIGKNTDSYGDYPYRYAFMREDAIGINGNHSVVFSISKRNLNLVAKFPRTPKNWWKVERGEIMQKKAYDLGVKVAKPEGLYKVFDLDNKEFHSGFVMEHLGMMPINELRSLKEQICEGRFSDELLNDLNERLKDSCIQTSKLHKRALDEYEFAKREAELKGFADIDYRETNAFWVPKLDDVRMIDCDEWNYYQGKTHQSPLTKT